jgi:hypothetical protein
VDQSAPEGGSFRQALEWAQRLHVPLLGISPSAWDFAEGSGRREDVRQTVPARGSGGDEGARINVEQACARACADRKISWQLTRWSERFATGLVRIAGNEDLFMFSRRTPAAQKHEILRDALRREAPATFICGDHGIPASRVLVLDNAASLDEDFLRTAAQVCLALQLTPVVVSVAGSEKAARQRQQAAFRAFADSNVEASFDYLVGCDVHSAVTQIACWRRCQMVIGQHKASAPWRRWLRDTTVEELMGVPEALGFLALSQTNRLTVAVPAVELAELP